MAGFPTSISMSVQHVKNSWTVSVERIVLRLSAYSLTPGGRGRAQLTPLSPKVRSPRVESGPTKNRSASISQWQDKAMNGRGRCLHRTSPKSLDQNHRTPPRNAPPSDVTLLDASFFQPAMSGVFSSTTIVTNRQLGRAV